MSDTGAARLPGLVVPRVDDPQLARWVQAVSERLEVREGQRGNAFERAATMRDLAKATAGITQILTLSPNPKVGETVLPLGNGMSAVVNVERFSEAIRNTRLFKDLQRRIDDPSRFDGVPALVREVLLRDIANEAAARGADIQRVETKVQRDYESLALLVEEITASVQGATAGVRELTYASASQNNAQAGRFTQLEASLQQFNEAGEAGRASLEQRLEVEADRVTGLRSQYTLKVQAGGALAGYGVSATEVNGEPESAFIIAANRFAIVDPYTYSGGLTNTPDVTNVPFGIDGEGIYLNGHVNIRGTLRVEQVDGAGMLARQNNVSTSQVTGLGTLATQNGVNVSQVTGLGTLATQNGVNVSQVTGLGTLATQSQVDYNFGVVNKPNFGGFAFLNTINSSNIAAYFSSAAIGELYVADAAITTAKIRDLAVGSLQIGNNAVTVPVAVRSGSTLFGDGTTQLVSQAYITIGSTATIFATFHGNQGFGAGVRNNIITLVLDGEQIALGGQALTTNLSAGYSIIRGPGTYAVSVYWYADDSTVSLGQRVLFVIGAQK